MLRQSSREELHRGMKDSHITALRKARVHHSIAWDLLTKLWRAVGLGKARLHHSTAWDLMAKLMHITALCKARLHHSIAWDLLAKLFVLPL